MSQESLPILPADPEAFCNIETKEDTAEKLAAVAGKPTKNFHFASEINLLRDKINELKAIIDMHHPPAPPILDANFRVSADWVGVGITNENSFNGFAQSLGGGNPVVVTNFVMYGVAESLYQTIICNLDGAVQIGGAINFAGFSLLPPTIQSINIAGSSLSQQALDVLVELFLSGDLPKQEWISPDQTTAAQPSPDKQALLNDPNYCLLSVF